MMLDVMRTTRRETLDDVIELCEGLAHKGYNAARCAQSLRDLKAKLMHFEDNFDVGHQT
jgi:hypothetical protein